MIDRVRLLFGLEFNFIALSRLIPAKSAFHKKEGERWDDRARSDTLRLVEKIKAHGILMGRGTRPFTLDQFSRMKRFSRNKRCIKACSHVTGIGSPRRSAILRGVKSTFSPSKLSEKIQRANAE